MTNQNERIAITRRISTVAISRCDKSLDTAPGQDHGNNFTDNFGGRTFLWHAATASGATPAPARPSSPAGYGNNQGGGY